MKFNRKKLLNNSYFLQIFPIISYVVQNHCWIEVLNGQKHVDRAHAFMLQHAFTVFYGGNIHSLKITVGFPGVCSDP